MLKSFPKILTIFFLTMFILQMIFLFFLLAAPVASQAAADTGIKFAPQVMTKDATGYEFKSNDKTTGNIANLVRAIYNYGIGIVGILAAVVLMYGGVLWIVAGGNTTQVGEAKSWIGAALTGLVLALTSYLILNTVNPALVNLTTSTVPGVAEFTNGSCTPTESPCVDNYTEDACKKIYGVFVKGGKCPAPDMACCAYDEAPYSSAISSYGTLYQHCVNQQNLTENDCRMKATTNGTKKYMEVGECQPYSFASLNIAIRYTCAAKSSAAPLNNLACSIYHAGSGFTRTILCEETDLTEEQVRTGLKTDFISYMANAKCVNYACVPR